MKYKAPIYEKTEIETVDIMTASGVVVNETSDTSADYSIDFSAFFKGSAI